MTERLTPRRIVDAVLFAATENEASHVAERRLASKLKQHPQIMEARLGRIRYVCSQLRIAPGCVLLDVGAGIGLNSVLALMCGVGEAHSVEMAADRQRSAALIVQYLGLGDRVHLHGQDVLTLDLPPNSIDTAFSFELLEHIRDIAALYHRLALWLKEGGRVYGRTGANGRNVIYQRTIEKTWQVIDQENYTGIREQVIRELVPEIPANDMKRLIGCTRGELLDGIRRIASEYKRNGTIPPPKPPCAPRDPHTGQYMERLLDPYDTMKVMDAQGFRTFLLRPSFRNITTVNPVLSLGLKVVGTVISAAHPVSLPVGPWLEFLSIKNRRNAFS